MSRISVFEPRIFSLPGDGGTSRLEEGVIFPLLVPLFELGAAGGGMLLLLPNIASGCPPSKEAPGVTGVVG